MSKCQMVGTRVGKGIPILILIPSLEKMSPNLNPKVFNPEVESVKIFLIRRMTGELVIKLILVVWFLDTKFL